MTRVREFYDSDRNEGFAIPASSMTNSNTNPVFCGICGEKYYLDDPGFEHFNSSFEKSSENPFVCEDCEAYFDERRGS